MKTDAEAVVGGPSAAHAVAVERALRKTQIRRCAARVQKSALVADHPSLSFAIPTLPGDAPCARETPETVPQALPPGTAPPAAARNLSATPGTRNELG